MNRKTELYKVALRQISNERVYSNEDILSTLIDAFYSENHFPVSGKIFEWKSKDLLYIIDSNEYSNSIRKVRFVYLKYNKKVNISNLRFQKTKTKSKNEGDEERQHIVIKEFNGNNEALMVWEKVLGSVSKSMLERDINRYYTGWIKQFDDCKRKELNKLRVRLDYIPSMEFVNELMQMDKISLIKVTVDKENLKFEGDEDISFNEDHISKDEVDLIYAPKITKSFSNAKVKSYFQKYMDGTGTERIKRLVIQGQKDRNTIRLDTEGMKLSKFIETELDIDGLVNSESLFNKYITLIESYSEQIGEMLLEVEDDEE